MYILDVSFPNDLTGADAPRVWLRLLRWKVHPALGTYTKYLIPGTWYREQESQNPKSQNSKIQISSIRYQISTYPDIRYEVSTKTNNLQINDSVVNKYLNEHFQFSVHNFEIILISDALTFQCASF